MLKPYKKCNRVETQLCIDLMHSDQILENIKFRKDVNCGDGNPVLVSRHFWSISCPVYVGMVQPRDQGQLGINYLTEY